MKEKKKIRMLEKFQWHRDNIKTLSFYEDVNYLSEEGKKSLKKSLKWVKKNESICYRIIYSTL